MIYFTPNLKGITTSLSHPRFGFTRLHRHQVFMAHGHHGHRWSDGWGLHFLLQSLDAAARRKRKFFRQWPQTGLCASSEQNVFPEHYQLLLVFLSHYFFGGSHGSPWGLWVEYGWIFVSLSGSWWQLVLWFVIHREHTFWSSKSLLLNSFNYFKTIFGPSVATGFSSANRFLWAFLTGFRRLNWL